MTVFPLWGGRRNPAAFFCVYRGVSRRLRQGSGKWQKAAKKALVKRFGEKTLQDFVRLEKWTAWLFELLGSFAFISDDRFSVIIFGELFDFKAVLFIEFNGIFVCFGEYGFYAVIIDQTVYHI